MAQIEDQNLAEIERKGYPHYGLVCGTGTVTLNASALGTSSSGGPISLTLDKVTYFPGTQAVKLGTNSGDLQLS